MIPLMTGKERKEKWQRKYLKNGLIWSNGSTLEASEYLGFSVRTVRNWLKRWPDLRAFTNEQSQKTIKGIQEQAASNKTLDE